eukprot:Nitzschia sp. Nitz4//scaffold7_size249615//105075//105710//NITZ4_001169-RA/size249615-processed-gene-0.192-mRNA-1//-1//CDS//3329558418//8909//frame0
MAAVRSASRIVRRLGCLQSSLGSSLFQQSNGQISSQAPHLLSQYNMRALSIMVTQTKASDLPSPDDLAEPVAAAGESSYKVLSESLKVTPTCVARVERLIQLRQQKEDTTDNFFLRVYVDAGGCSGFQYQFELDQEFIDDEDIVVIANNQEEPRVVIDEISLGFLEGSTLDYVQEMIKSAFAIVDNPNSETACGCGSSFALKNFAANPALD